MIEYHKGWYVLYVKFRHEKKVHESLKKISIDSFFPIIKELRKRSDRKIIIEKPLFPSYIFIYSNSSLDFYKALSVDGVFMYIRFGMEYAKINDLEIKKIKILTGDQNITNIEVSQELPNTGTLMKITHGPLNGLKCKVIKVNNENKIIVQIESLRHNITATIPSSYVEVVEI